MNRDVLISGAGVAGLALAHWLDKAGFAVTVVELQPAFRRGGQAIDIRGVALDVVQAMGLLDKIRELRTHNKGMSTLDAAGVEIERTEERTFSAGRTDGQDVELFRDDLCQLLMKSLSNAVEFVYGDSIASLAEHGDKVEVSFTSGKRRTFDMVVGADGVYSKTRRLWFNDDASYIKSLGVVMALFTTPNFIGLQHWELIHRSGGVGYVVYPSLDQSELRVGIGFGASDTKALRADIAAQKAMVENQCQDLGGHMPAFIQAMHVTDQFYCNELAQIRMPNWSKGRVVLAGDAAHCASPFSGQGTSLALVGAFVLGRELARHADRPELACAAYEASMRPFVQINQDMVDPTRRGSIPDEVMTRSKNGIELSGLLRELS
ncbi:MAG TPA: FAD-dependent monooxygenase [Dyella sp.]|uniref:FAD-dependent monooxygenase n=1 Tax=Dyella sp. TaxID=1869338 RepID=UPI002D790175|nr:FAD-dependent monooxygenase [Dyella sp.]HET6552549.1 FAD-dependent monooxygenase [Dyella sp.]